MKRQRQQTLLDLIRQESLGSQEEIRRRLAAVGYDATQSTISRDLEELGLVRIRDGKGRPRYAQLDEAAQGNNHHVPALDALMKEFALAVDVSGDLVLIKTPPGAANAVAQGLDHSDLAGLLGTVAGDDTILAVASSGASSKTLAGKLRALAGLP